MSKFIAVGLASCIGGLLILGFQAIQTLMNPDAAILEKGKETFETKFDYLMAVGEVKTSK